MFAHKVRSVYIVALLLIAAAAVYLFWPRVRPEQMRAGYVPPIPGLKAEEYPKVGCVPTTQVLRDLLAAKALQLPAEVRYRGASEDDSPAAIVTIPSSKNTDTQAPRFAKACGMAYAATNLAYATLINKSVGMLLVAQEQDNDKLDAKPIALDAFVIIVNAKNPVKSLLISELRDIFTGKITNWKQVGGPNEPIHVGYPDVNSTQPWISSYFPRNDTLQMLQHDVFQDKWRTIHIDWHATPDTVFAAVADDPNAISFSTFYRASVLNPNAGVRAMAVQDVEPRVDTITDASYPFVEPIYAVVRADAKPDSPEVRLRDWLTSKNGQQLVGKAGFIPLTMVKNVPEE